jgi:hypothetical protein
MDKNFISIDDLVRQRLGGGEERERSGSWANMRELLDKEMPQEKPVGMYWRRMLSATAILLLIAGITVGGYELNAYRNNAASDNGVVAAVTPAPTGNEAVNNTNKTTNNIVSTTNENKPANNSDVNNTHANTVAHNTATTHVAKKHITTAGHKNETGKGTLLAAATEAHSETETTKTVTSSTANSVSDKEVNSVNSKEAVAATNTAIAAKSNNKELAANNSNATATDNSKEVVARNDKVAATSNSSTAVHKKAAKHSAAVTTSIAKSDATVTTTAVTANTVTIADNDNKIAANNYTNAKDNKTAAPEKEGMDAMALSSNVPAHKVIAAANTKSVKTKKGATAKHNTIVMDKLPLSSAVPATVNNIAAAPATSKAIDADKVADKVAAPKAIAANNVIVPAATVSGVVTPGVVAASNTVAPEKSAKKTTHTIPAANMVAASVSNNTANPVTTPLRKSSRQVQKLTIAQHFVRTTSTGGYLKMDTISQETITEEYSVAENTYQPTVFGPPPYDKPVPVNSHAVVTIDSRENNLKNRKSTTSTIENLSAAFNDMKNQVSGVRFAAGLTAGVNGTFFGPNSFKGFQFGVTGTFTFNETFSLMSELKYFHRINNDYTLNDNFYSYTPNPSGGYTRELVNYPYSFSTLHSFELPISARYSVGKMSFFAGPNFVYTFAINTGAANLPDPTTATQVSTLGNDNAPKLKASDFDARFGVGYLLGLSCKVAPNVTLDLRNVQTVWDNAPTTGSKFVSSQLYKSPSIQFSIGYTLGKNARGGK